MSCPNAFWKAAWVLLECSFSDVPVLSECCLSVVSMPLTAVWVLCEFCLSIVSVLCE